LGFIQHYWKIQINVVVLEYLLSNLRSIKTWIFFNICAMHLTKNAEKDIGLPRFLAALVRGGQGLRQVLLKPP